MDDFNLFGAFAPPNLGPSPAAAKVLERIAGIAPMLASHPEPTVTLRADDYDTLQALAPGKLLRYGNIQLRRLELDHSIIL